MQIGQGSRKEVIPVRINLKIDEVSVLRNALATRHDDLRDLIAQWSKDEQMSESEQLHAARAEFALVADLDAKLAAAR